MGDLSLQHLIIVLIVSVLQVIPLAPLFERAGKSLRWSGWGLFPFAASPIGVWIDAYSQWPLADRGWGAPCNCPLSFIALAHD